MSCQATKAVWAAFMILAVTVLGQLSQREAEEQSDWLVSYCTDAALWTAEEARGVPLEKRTGQPDYKGIAKEHCPGMRPAAPALDSDSPYSWPCPTRCHFSSWFGFKGGVCTCSTGLANESS